MAQNFTDEERRKLKLPFMMLTSSHNRESWSPGTKEMLLCPSLITECWVALQGSPPLTLSTKTGAHKRKHRMNTSHSMSKYLTPLKCMTSCRMASDCTVINLTTLFCHNQGHKVLNIPSYVNFKCIKRIGSLPGTPKIFEYATFLTIQLQANWSLYTVLCMQRC